ncbi:MAG: hypothetical protein ACR2O6_10575, partial [Ilumatobacteraceae bacterium]
LGAGALLHRLVIQETGDPVTARRSVRLFALFPPAFVLVLAYSEALYVFLAIAVILALRARQWWAAAALAYLAGLTRPVAGLLALPAAVHAWRAGATRRPAALASIIAAPLGTATFLIWAGIALDDWRAPIDRQRELRGDATEPISRWFRGLGRALDGDEGELFHILAASVILILALVTIRRLALDLVVYTVPSAVILVSAENLNSLERYALAAFPLVIAAALVSRDEHFDRWLPTASAVGLASLTTLTLNGGYVP